MKADFTKRVVRAIADGSRADLEKLAIRIVEDERKSGHGRLADELDMILKAAGSKNPPRLQPVEKAKVLNGLPVSRRHGEELATVFPAEHLEHHMVLPARVEAKFERIEREFAARDRLATLGLRPRRTILLYGPPGCGKSLGAKRLAWRTGLPLLKVRFDALVSSYFGESASNLRTLFLDAKSRPCVLLLDECDFIARSRGGRNDIGEASRLVNSLLQEMEDYSGKGILVATTNVQEALDPALFRRFDDAFHIPLPGPQEIDKLLRLTLSAIRVQRTDWAQLVRRLKGAPAAFVVKAAQDAAKAAVLSGGTIVTESHLLEAIAELHFVLERK